MNELIVVEQLPVIREQLESISQEIDKKVKKAGSLACTEETVKEIKKARAALKKEFEEFEEQRKNVKNVVMKPYLDFENAYKEYISDKYETADSVLKNKISSVESELKQKKEQEIKWYFEELLSFHKIDFIKFEQSGINVTLSASMKSLKEQAKKYIERITKDVELIKTQEYQSEIMYEYKRTLNVSKAISAVTSRNKALGEERTRQEELSKEKETQRKSVEAVNAFAAPEIDGTDDPIGKITFQVTATISKLRELKEFLKNGGYEYEQQ